LSGYALWFYIKNFFFPFPLNAVHPYPVRTASGAFPTEYYITLLCLLAVIAISGLLIWKRKKIPGLLFFGWFFFLVNISMVLHFIPIEGRLVAADRYSYFAYLGLILSVTSLGERYLFQNQKHKNKIPVFLVILLILLSTLTYQRCKVWKNTRVLFSDVLHKTPDIPFAYCTLAATYMNSQMPDSAIYFFNKAIKLDPLDPGAYFNRAFAYMAKNDKKKAIEDFDTFCKIISEKKFKALGYTHIGEIYRNYGADSLAIFNYNLALKTDSTLPEAYNARGIYFLNINNLDQAKHDFIKAIHYNTYYAEAYNNLGSVFMTQGNSNEAQKYFNRAIDINPEYTLAYDNRGYLKYVNGDGSGAIKDFNIAINLNPRLTQTYIKRGRAYAQMKNYKNAIDDFSFVIGKEPENMIALTNRAYAWFYMNDLVNAAKDFSLCTELFHENAITWQNLAWFHMQIKKYDAATDEYERSVKLDSSLIISYINLGWIYMNNGNISKAEHTLLQSIEINPKSSQSLFLLGELYRKKGDKNSSCSFYQKSSDLGDMQAKNALNLYCASPK